MSKYEKLGNFLLLEKIEEDKLSKNFLAGQIVNNQIQQFSMLKKFDHSLSTIPDFILDLNQEWEILKSLANPNIVRPSSFVQEKSEFAAIFEYVEGKSVGSILNKCQQDGYPFTADHVLLVGSRICTALEYLHSKKINGERLIHGFICPETVFVTYDGEIKLQYLGLSQVLMRFPAGREKLLHDYRSYLAPEALNNSKMDQKADIFSAGLIILEMLSGEPLPPKARETGFTQVVENVQMYMPSGERVPIADDIKKVLLQALANDPNQRYASAGDMRKALDQLLFTSDYSPTTFNLAFFMHSLFRESIDEETKSMASFKKVDVASVVKEEPPAKKPEPPVGAEAAKDLASIPIALATSMAQPQMFGGAQEVREKSKTPLFVGILVGVAVIGAVAFMMFKPSTPATNTAQSTPAALSEAQLKANDMERQKLQAEAKKAVEDAKAKDQALKDLQAKLDALMKQQEKQKDKANSAIDPAQIQQLQEQARRLEEEKKQQQALAEEKLKAAQQQQQQQQQEPQQAAAVTPATEFPSAQKPADQKTAEQKPAEQKAAEQKPTQIASATPPQVLPAATNTTQTPTEKPAPVQDSTADATKSAPSSSVNEGDIVELTPDVVRPEPLNKVNPAYPPIARTRKIEGTVILTVLISERGDVADVRLLRGVAGAAGLNESAIAAIKKWKFRPAVKEGKRVKVWVTYPVVFKLQ